MIPYFTPVGNNPDGQSSVSKLFYARGVDPDNRLKINFWPHQKVETNPDEGRGIHFYFP